MPNLIKSLDKLESLKLNGNTFDPQGIGALQLIEAAESMQRLDILDEWDEMEYESEEPSIDNELLDQLENLTVNQRLFKCLNFFKYSYNTNYY